MPTTTDSITTADGTCRVTVATPEGAGPWPGVVLFPDAGGLRPTMEEMAAKLAGFGYVVLVPDVYYRNPGWGRSTSTRCSATRSSAGSSSS